MNRLQIAAASVGALGVVVFVVVGGNVLQQTTYLADAGYSPTHVATCQVRLSPECVALATDAGFPLRTYERVRFPVSMATLADGGRDVQLPPLPLASARRCVEVVDWNDCTIVLAASAPAIAALWGQPVPFTTLGTVKRCVRAKLDAGLACDRRQADGGVFSFGDRNVFQRAEAVAPATCEPVECGPVVLGEDPETEL